jgi:hypothetical protein
MRLDSYWFITKNPRPKCDVQGTHSGKNPEVRERFNT